MPYLHPSREQLSSSKEKSKHSILNILGCFFFFKSVQLSLSLYVYILLIFKKKEKIVYVYTHIFKENRMIGLQGVGKLI